ncbi:MAG: UDP-3-O-(3-hydroxymyristoyl)glucosamine N-acyltransferase [Epsilonproteobacteria bacterium]|nr:UDP-3-O-(3-hydroxymyristoyl)glucosamine N-acyltransferase [Campylobacterota bacterium]
MKLKEIADILEIELNTDKDVDIKAMNTLLEAKEDEITFFNNKKYLDKLQTTKAGAVILQEEFVKYLPQNTVALITSHPYLKMAQLTKYFVKDYTNLPKPTISDSAKIGKNVVIHNGSKIADNVVIMDNSVIMHNVTIQEGSIIYPNVTIYPDTQIGKNVIIHAGNVIGGDGFGYAHTSQGEHVKIYHLGAVVLEDDVEIGANSSIDRGAFGKTLIKKGAKIDNLVQIGHNCEIGEYCIIVSQVGLAGSSKLGRNVVMGGQAATAGHLEIAPFTQIAARGGVTKTIKESGVYAGFPLIPHKLWLKLQAKILGLVK